jgi:CNT family concentrative nucleoside transporter
MNVPPQLVSVLGYVVLLALAWALGQHRRRVSWRVVAGGTFLQFVFALAILRTTLGRWVFDGIGSVFEALLGYVDAGSLFVFGPKYQDFYFAFRILPTIIFVSSLMSILYHLGVMQRVVAAAAWCMQRTLGTSGAESLSAAANIFVGQTEAPLLIRPYVPTMTRSELMAVMVGGFATVSGGVLAAYVGMGIDARHLVTASVISAPAALMCAKLMQPEVDTPQTLGTVRLVVERRTVNVIEAAADGASEGLKLALNVAAMLLAFMALIALADGVVVQLGRWCGQSWSLSAALGYLFAPLAWLIGVERADCYRVGELLGLKMVANEFVAYERFATWLKEGSPVTLAPRSQALVTYALCGFSNFASIGIQIGGIGAMAPERRPDLARLGLRAMLGGTLACLLTACVVGILL